MIAAVAVYFGEYLMDNIHKMNLVAVGIYIHRGLCGGSDFLLCSYLYSIFGKIS